MANPNIVHPISTDKAPSALGPYSQGVKTSTFVFCSGQIAIEPETAIFTKGGISEQTHQILKNIKAVLEAAGSDIAYVVKTTVFLTDMSDFEAMNKVYGEYFKGSLPARSTIQVSALPKGAPIEIEAIAVLP
jgi:2-iminobutanoate/2-iminopropanoate deaminase